MPSPMPYSSPSPLLIVALTILFWMVQPWMMQTMVIHRHRSRIFLAIVVFATVTSYLGSQLHHSLRDRVMVVKPMWFILLWYPPAMQFFRYLHALSVGGTEFAHHFGLTDPKRVAIFMWSVPTVLFLNDHRNRNENEKNQEMATTSSKKQQQHQDDHHHEQHRLRFREDVQVALMDIFLTVALCASVLLLKLDIFLPDCLQRVIRVYIMGLSTSIFKLVLEVPSRFLLLRVTNSHNNNNNHNTQVTTTTTTTTTRIRIIPIFNRPYLTRSPRGLWHRWSITAGYHLRKAFYEPLLVINKNNNNNIHNNWITTTGVATAAPFLVNCILHITWWSLVVKGEMDFIYIQLLFVYPLLSFGIQDVVIRRLFQVVEKRSSSSSSTSNKRDNHHQTTPSPTTTSTTTSTSKSMCHHLANLLVLWIGFYSISESVSTAHALNSSLTGVCRANLGLPV